ncbi:Platelet glycoprotein V [Holothuria leucospilota]|uniref:Platelet glycoprotein V n=1 Tax=Holothuria leucospilota TaxID=206669 RepID=A0A9Q1CU51_HOLLE|nr:Platelet glycoprotein V [Holothuria leucospilota]
MNLTSADELGDEIPQSVADILIAHSNTSFIKNGNWSFLSNLTELKRLTFVNNGIRDMSEFKPSYVKNLANLDYLTIDRNNLNIFPVEKFTELKRLVYLCLICNQLQTLGEVQWNLPLLESLIVSSNQITGVRAKQLNGLVSLRRLDMSNNRITYFSLKVLDSLPKLKFLDLSDNRLFYLSEYNVVHKNLQSVRLRNNLFEFLDPLAFNGLMVLQNIIAAENYIKEPPHTRSDKNLTSVSNLSFLKNKIEKLSPLFFDNFPGTYHISLSKNKIRHIANDTFRRVTNLGILCMDYNEIETIPHNLFQHLHHLSFIYLANNRIKILAPGILKGLPKFTEVFLLDNPIVCNCSNVPLAKWLDGSMTLSKYYPRCQYPESLENQTLSFAVLPSNCSDHQVIKESPVVSVHDATVTAQTTHDPTKLTFLFELKYIAAVFALLLACHCVLCLKAAILRDSV